MIKLSKWAKLNGVTYHTAWNLYRDGKLPVAARQLATGTILVDEPSGDFIKEYVVIYARVSSGDQKSSLDSQITRCLDFANKQGLSVNRTVKEIGSGLNGRRTKLLSLFKDKDVTHIIVEHKDRLMRFGFEYIDTLMAAHGQKILVVDESEMQDDLVQDMIDVLTSFCARLYGRRSVKSKINKAMKALTE